MSMCKIMFTLFIVQVTFSYSFGKLIMKDQSINPKPRLFTTAQDPSS